MRELCVHKGLRANSSNNGGFIYIKMYSQLFLIMYMVLNWNIINVKGKKIAWKICWKNKASWHLGPLMRKEKEELPPWLQNICTILYVSFYRSKKKKKKKQQNVAEDFIIKSTLSIVFKICSISKMFSIQYYKTQQKRHKYCCECTVTWKTYRCLLLLNENETLSLYSGSAWQQLARLWTQSCLMSTEKKKKSFLFFISLIKTDIPPTGICKAHSQQQWLSLLWCS